MDTSSDSGVAPQDPHLDAGAADDDEEASGDDLDASVDDLDASGDDLDVSGDDLDASSDDEGTGKDAEDDAPAESGAPPSSDAGSAPDTSASACEPTCAPGEILAGLPGTPYCAALQLNCGSDADCSIANTQGSCREGRCERLTCTSGVDCDGDPGNGCETPLSSIGRGGYCPVCYDGGCGPGEIGYVPCGGGMWWAENDLHCGSCSNACAAGLACFAGECVAPVVQEVIPAPSLPGLLVDDTALYWTARPDDRPLTVYRALKSDWQPVPIAELSLQPYRWYMGPDHIVWGDESLHGIYELAKTGGVPRLVYAVQRPAQIVADGSHLYFCAKDDPQFADPTARSGIDYASGLYRFDRSTGTALRLTTSPCTYVAVDDRAVYAGCTYDDRSYDGVPLLAIDKATGVELARTDLVPTGHSLAGQGMLLKGPDLWLNVTANLGSSSHFEAASRPLLADRRVLFEVPGTAFDGGRVVDGGCFIYFVYQSKLYRRAAQGYTRPQLIRGYVEGWPIGGVVGTPVRDATHLYWSTSTAIMRIPL